jgi:hypothetical protein
MTDTSPATIATTSTAAPIYYPEHHSMWLKEMGLSVQWQTRTRLIDSHGNSHGDELDDSIVAAQENKNTIESFPWETHLERKTHVLLWLLPMPPTTAQTYYLTALLWSANIAMSDAMCLLATTIKSNNAPNVTKSHIPTGEMSSPQMPTLLMPTLGVSASDLYSFSHAIQMKVPFTITQQNAQTPFTQYWIISDLPPQIPGNTTKSELCLNISPQNWADSTYKKNLWARLPKSKS